MTATNNEPRSSVTGRKLPVTHKDLTIAYMLEGLDAVGTMLASHTNPVACLETAIETLQANGKDVSELSMLRDTFANAKVPGKRGRSAARIGDNRQFSVQQVGVGEEASDVFIRLPLSTLGVVKGQRVSCRFLEGEIIVSLVDSAESAE